MVRADPLANDSIALNAEDRSHFSTGAHGVEWPWPWREALVRDTLVRGAWQQTLLEKCFAQATVQQNLSGDLLFQEAKLSGS